MMTSSNGNIFRVTGVTGIHRWPVNSPHKGRFSWYALLLNGWVINRQAGDLIRRHDIEMFTVSGIISEHKAATPVPPPNQPSIHGFYSIHKAVRRFTTKIRSREIKCHNGRFALKFDKHLGRTAAEVPVKFKSDWKSLYPNLAASSLHEILRWDACPLSE